MQINAIYGIYLIPVFNAKSGSAMNAHQWKMLFKSIYEYLMVGYLEQPLINLNNYLPIYTLFAKRPIYWPKQEPQ